MDVLKNNDRWFHSTERWSTEKEIVGKMARKWNCREMQGRMCQFEKSDFRFVK